MKKIKKRIKKIRNKIKYLKYLYYVKNFSKISDQNYDNLIQELKRLEKYYPYDNMKSPSKTIGNNIDPSFAKNQHNIPMLSLNSTLKIEDFIKFDLKIKKKINEKILYCCEQKIDGIALNLIYKNKKLFQALTRGNGYIGENVTKSVYYINDIPKKLKGENIPNLIEIRGEVFMLKKNFRKLNETDKGKKFSSTRNAASGMLRQLNPKINDIRYLNFYAYGTGFSSNQKIFKNHWEKFEILEDWGMPINKYNHLCKDYKEVIAFFNKINNIKHNSEFDIDGIVIKVNSIDAQNALGYTANAPKWSIALKFEQLGEKTKIKRINFQVNRRGLITPIAIFKKIRINGANINKANLYNIKEIKKLGLMIGDTIEVNRIGDVIPKITKVIKSERYNTFPIEYPKVCPICNSKLVYENNKIQCIASLTCTAQIEEKIRHFVSKDGIYIEGMGKKIIKKLLKYKIITKVSDIFKLKEVDFKIFGKNNKKFIENLLKSINSSKENTLSNFIYAIGINGIGKNLAKKIALKYKSIEKIISADVSSINTIPNLGIKMSMKIRNFFQDTNNIRLIKDLLKLININKIY